MNERARALAQALTQAGLAGRRLVADSRAITPGDLFVAQRGRSVDGHEFIAAAVARGAAAVIAEAAPAGLAVPVFTAPTGEPALLAELCNLQYGWPSRALRVIGVTGTNGKTSVTQWLAAALTADGSRAAVVGTLGVRFGDTTQATQNTTPVLITLHGVLAELRDGGAQQVAIEVSSHALDQERVAGIEFASAIFTNLTPDHLDYHGTMEAYGRAKARLFEDYAVGTRIVNVDDAFGRALATRLPAPVLTYGIEAGDVRAEALTVHEAGQRFRLTGLGQPVEVTTQAVGRFNIHNLLAVACALHAEGRSAERIAALLGALPAVPGRLERVQAEHAGRPALPTVYVDYAHTPDALAKALEALRPQTAGRLWVVFGCGGNRDRTKRPLMGRIAAERADRVLVTTDNPRFEAPESIIADIMNGVPAQWASRVSIEADRARAIGEAIGQARPGDVVLVAGKGHETYQEVAGVRRHFDDREEARRALSGRASSEGAAHV